MWEDILKAFKRPAWMNRVVSKEQMGDGEWRLASVILDNLVQSGWKMTPTQRELSRKLKQSGLFEMKSVTKSGADKTLPGKPGLFMYRLKDL